MARVVNRYFWVLTVICVVLCCGLAARAANHVVESSMLGEPGAADPPADVAAVAAPERRVAPRPRKDGRALVERNMFCAECTPETPAVEVPAGEDRGGIPVTALPIQLLATSLATRPERSFATVRNTATEGQGSYWPGDAIPGAGKVERVGGTFVVFHNPQTDRLEQATLLSSPATPRAPEPSPAAGQVSSAFDDQIRQVDATTWEVDRDLITQAVGNPMKVGVRLYPIQRDGELTGFRMSGIRPSSAPFAIGLRNGDVLNAVNGYQLSADPSKMLELYTKLKESSQVSVEITRRGQPQTLSYNVR